MSQSILLDSAKPTGRVVINAGAELAAALDGAVQLQFFPDGDTSGIQSVRISNTNGNGDLDGAPAIAYANEKMWTLSPAGSGYDTNRTVYVKFVDGAGNGSAAAVTDAVRYDTQAPTVGATPIGINGGAFYATSTFATLTLAATGAAEMQLANEGVFTETAWEPYKTQSGWYLQATEGQRGVAVKFRDAAGNVVGPYAATVTLDTARPSNPSVTMNLGANYASAVTVSLSLFAVGAGWMQVSNDGVFDTELLEAYAGTKSWVLAAGDGVKAVYVRFLDNAGNTSDVVSDYIILDTTPPSSILGSVAINAGATYTNHLAGTVTLTLSSLEATRVYLSEAGCGIGGAWVDYASTRSFTLSMTQGAHNVYALFQDIAGNLSDCESDSIILAFSTRFCTPHR